MMLSRLYSKIQFARLEGKIFKLKKVSYENPGS